MEACAKICVQSPGVCWPVRVVVWTLENVALNQAAAIRIPSGALKNIQSPDPTQTYYIGTPWGQEVPGHLYFVKASSWILRGSPNFKKKNTALR